VSAHPNSRFTVSARNNPIYSPRSEDPMGVPISALIFGGRRREVAPLVYEARDWQHGVLVGASVASETTAAATGAVGVVRRDPMAMKPFAGYNFGDYWRHWIEVGKRLRHPPKLFHVNWFRRDAKGAFLWPGYGDNLRVMEWILKRCAGKVAARESAIGYLPHPEDLNLQGVDVSGESMKELLAVSTDAWRGEAAQMREYLKEFGDRAPAEMYAELGEIERRLG
jgi:phosphoenolpyruvate carboxykinase (GTP)